MLLIYVVLVLPFRYVVYLLAHVLLKELFLLHSHLVRHCISCLGTVDFK